MKARAVAILRIGRARLAERRDRAGPIAELGADRAEREPCGGEVWRQRQRLVHEIGGIPEIAARP